MANYEDTLVSLDQELNAVLRDERSPLLAKKSERQGSFLTILALWNTMIATTVLSLPWAIKEAGLLCGLLFLLVIAAVMAYTTYLVLHSVDKLHDGQTLEFHDVCQRFLGRPAKALAMMGSLLTLLCGMIIYWILLASFIFHIGNFLYNVIHTSRDPSLEISAQNGHAVCVNKNWTQATASRGNMTAAGPSVFQDWWNETRTIPIYLVVVLFPLLHFKKATVFTRMNSIGMLSLVYLVVFVAVKAVEWGVHLDLRPDPSADPAVKNDLFNWRYVTQFKQSFPALTGVAALGFFVQNSVLYIVRNQKHPQHNTRDIILAYILVAVTYIYVGGVFYITFPFNKGCIADSLLNNVAPTDVYALVARVGLSFQLICILPQIFYIARIQLFITFFDNPWPSAFHVLALNAILVTICVLFAVFLPHVGRILSFVGALNGFYYAVGLPCLVKCVTLRKEGRLTCFHVVFHVFLVLLGLFNFVGQFLIMDET